MNILAVGAHHDDVELGCGGSLARFVAEGHTVYGIILTDSETHYDLKGIHRTKEQALAEASRAAACIGMTLCDLDYPKATNGTLTYDVQLMRAMENFIAAHRIDCVFTHWRYDLNTDHEAVAKIAAVAARHVPRLLAYRSNWYQPDRAFNGMFYIDISQSIEQKIKSLECYAGEILNRSRQWMETFIDRERNHGFSIGVKYAEAFELIRWVV